MITQITKKAVTIAPATVIEAALNKAKQNRIRKKFVIMLASQNFCQGMDMDLGEVAPKTIEEAIEIAKRSVSAYGTAKVEVRTSKWGREEVAIVHG